MQLQPNFKFIEVQDVKKSLICNVCENPIEAPRACSDCGKRFCHVCIKDTKVCPNDECKNENTTFEVVSDKFKQELMKLKIRCTLCDKEMRRADFDKHYVECKIIKCEGSIFDCEFMDKTSKVQEHQLKCSKANLVQVKKAVENVNERRVAKQKQVSQTLKLLTKQLDELQKAHLSPKDYKAAKEEREKKISEINVEFNHVIDGLDKLPFEKKSSGNKSPIKSTTKKDTKTPETKKTETKKTEPKKTEPKKTATTETKASTETKPPEPKKTETKKTATTETKASTETKTPETKKTTTTTKASTETKAPETSNTTSDVKNEENAQPKEAVVQEYPKNTETPKLKEGRKKKASTQENNSNKKRKKNSKN